MKKIFLIIVFLIGFLINIDILAYDLKKDDKIYVGGESLGLKLDNGVVVAGTYGIYKNGRLIKPWEKAMIQDGDKIISLNNEKIENVKDLLKILREVKDKNVKIEYIRNEKLYTSYIKPELSDDSYSLGLYVKDSIMGIGTLTYYIKDANIFGSLGHSITDDDFYSGSVYKANVDEIIKPTRNEAGKKIASIDSQIIGEISKNTITGVHGSFNENFDVSNMKLLPFKEKEEVNLGPAQIITNISDDEINTYDIFITKLEKQEKKDIKGITFVVVDNDLINKTGGIVQGMSGSPIIQDGMIIGAVTHVSLNDSKKGYGIYLEFMFEDMNINIIE